MDKQALLMLQEVIEKTLARIPSPTREPEPEPEAETKPASPSPTIDDLVEELVDEVVDEPLNEPQTDGLETETVASEKPDDGDTIVESNDEDVEMLL